MFILYGLEYCPYCIKSVQLLSMHNIPHKMNWIEESDKDKYKKKHKMSTFPQIFYKISPKNKKMVKIGGFDDIERMFLVAKAIKQNSFDIRAINFITKNM